ncbi:MAG: GGDEF domain-containing protein [Legionellales bacterium]|nr:GGDEF domain-containing protein [Legionellales bacterium]
MIDSNSQPNFSRKLWLTLGTLAAFFIIFGLYSYVEGQAKQAHATELKSEVLSDELRQTSDDLSRMVRLYVSTGDTLYKQHYQEILDIRNGLAARPIFSAAIYWDLVLEDNKRPRANGPAISLLGLMRRAQFSEAEFQELARAKAKSDELTQMESGAMKQVESSPHITDVTRLKAIQRLSNQTYLQAKRDIMLPIARFEAMVNQRTQKTVQQVETEADWLLAVLLVLGFILVYMLWQTYRALNATLGCSADKLRAVILQMGNSDFSTPLIVPKSMSNSVLNWLNELQNKIFQSESKLKVMVEKMHELAYYDALTNLPNRRMLTDRLRQAFALSQRYREYGALMYIDLDHFKPLNDEHGHNAGDILLKEVARRLTNSLRDTDTIARVGGDEFVVVLGALEKDESKSRVHALSVAEKIRKILAKPYSIILPNRESNPPILHSCTASIGVVLFLDKENHQEALLKSADMAMYQAKEKGRNQIRMLCRAQP